ncbi:MAG TPA: ABC transporter ATP-binding protein, partial [Spirochaetia bacterium]|nr:ABC transporter ATP-binding protein [Spirochaetia bacterium]
MRESLPPTPDVRSSMQRRGGRPAKFEKAQNPRRALTRLVLYLKPYPASLGLVTGCVFLYTLLGLVGPYLLGQAIDTFIGGKNVAGLLRTVVLMVIVYGAGNALQVAANWVMARVAQRALKVMRGDLFAHLQTLSMHFFDTHPAGGLMSRLTNDIDAINQAVSQNVTSLVASALSMVGILIAMFVLNHWLALASLLVVPIMIWFTRFVSRYTRKGFRDLQKSLGELNSVTEEAISGQKVIKAFRRNESVLEAFRAQNEAVFRAGVFANSYALLLMPLTAVLGTFFVIVLAGVGGWLALQGLLSVGMIATFITYGQNFTSPLRQIANLYNSIQAALAGAERVFEIIDTPSEMTDPPDAPALSSLRGDVSLRGVQFS